MKVLVLSFLVIFLSYSSGNQHYCGRILSDTLSYMCEQENMVKRALHNYGFQGNRGQSPVLTQGYRDGESPVLSEGNGNHLSVDVQSMKLGGSRRQEFSWPWFGQQQALALSSIRGKRQGIADECCLKSCSLDELLSYC